MSEKVTKNMDDDYATHRDAWNAFYTDWMASQGNPLTIEKIIILLCMSQDICDDMVKEVNPKYSWELEEASNRICKVVNLLQGELMKGTQ